MYYYMIYTNDELNVLIEQTLNLHGIDRVVSLIADMLEREYENGYEAGEQEGWNDCYDTYIVDIEEDYND